MKNRLLFTLVGLCFGPWIFSQNYLACDPPDGPPAEDCFSACAYAGPLGLNGFYGSNKGYSTDSVPGFCSTVENDQWFGFVAGEVNINLEIRPDSFSCKNGDGLQAAIFEHCNEPALKCNPGCDGCGNSSVYLTTIDLIKGKTYFLMIDGRNGDECDFTIGGTIPFPCTPPPIGSVGPITGPSQSCPGGTATYCLDAVSGAGYYNWLIPAGASINGQPGPGPITLEAPTGTCAEITFGPSVGVKTICVTPFNAAAMGQQKCKAVTIEPIPTTWLDPQIVCYEDWVDGNVLCCEMPLPPGTNNCCCIYQTPGGCDSTVCQIITVKPQLVKNLPLKIICPGENVFVGGQPFSDPGSYSVTIQSWQGCDSTINFTLHVLNPIAQIIGPDSLCIGGQITLTTANSGGPVPLKTWKNAAGQTLGTGNSLVVSQPDTVILTVQQQQGGVVCAAMDTFIVHFSGLFAPNLTVLGDTISCAEPIGQLSASFDSTVVQFHWAGPNGFADTATTFQSDYPGIYRALAVAANGCLTEKLATLFFEKTDETGTFSFLKKVVHVFLPPASTTSLTLSDSLKNESPTVAEMEWKLKNSNLPNGCQPKVEDKLGIHAGQSVGKFTLAPGETAPLNVHFTDGPATACCGFVQLECRNLCTTNDTASIFYEIDCSVSQREPVGEQVRILPGAENGLFFMENLPENAAFLQISGIDGRLILNEKRAGDFSFSLKAEPSGLFFVVVKTEAGQVFQPVKLIWAR